MDEFRENLKIAEGMEEEIARINKIQEEIDRVNKEIGELQKKEKEIKTQPDRIEAYKKRLAKLQEEIEKQNAITKKIETPDEILKLSKMVSQKELATKVLEYFNTLYSEKSTVLSINQVKIKVNYIEISLVYNELLQTVNSLLPSHSNVYIKTVSKLVSDYILLYSTAISAIADNALIIITYAVSKKTELSESEIQEKIVGDLLKESKESVENLTDKKLYENISKLAVYEDILVEVKKRIQADLLKISLKQLNRYNNEVFYGTIYHIEDIDKWMCDNLVIKIDEPAESVQITESEQREIFSGKAAQHNSVLDLLAESMKKQKISKISKGFHRIVKIIRNIEHTERSKNEKIHPVIVEKIHKFFKRPSEKVGVEGVLSASLRLADAQAMLGIIMLSKDKKSAETGANHISRMLGQIEEHFIDVVEEAFADIISCSEAGSINFLNRNVLDKIENANNDFIETTTDIFTDTFLAHIKTMFYSRLLSSAYHAVETTLEDLPAEDWKNILSLLLRIVKPHKQFIDYYPYIEAIYRILLFDGSATEFLKAYNETGFPLPNDLIQELVVYSFKDPRVARNVLNNLEKQQKKE
ncbi:hypothetical protein NEMIN01_0799 [Nematocida minor]|uniref:uncharacterized protein n=1 Tax=Nematocida minor TaxID=1912983 RepID=UPI002220BB63|nr:uncharacterized protein NEMIN01_0799 [Nematocida minor]KAI5190014.1 hypothetical protein NEMIN01_0799 [Nematocida minor]